MAEPVGQRRQKQIADQETGKRRGENGAEDLVRELPFLGDQRGHVADRLGIEAVEKHDEAAQADDGILRSAEWTRIDKVWDMQHFLRRRGLHGRHERPGGRRGVSGVSAGALLLPVSDGGLLDVVIVKPFAHFSRGGDLTIALFQAARA